MLLPSRPAILASSLLVLAGLPGIAFGQGAQDLAFGVGGLARAGTGANERWNDVRVQADGKILVAGAAGTGLIGGPGTFFIARYLPTGVLDTGFGGSGVVTLPLSTAKSIAIQPDGKILVGGDGSVATFTTDGVIISQTAALGADVSIARLNANGSLDTSFGVNGLVRTDLTGNRIGTAERLVLLPGGRIWAVGAVSSPRGETVTNWSIIAYTANGAIDTAFGAGGQVQIDFGQTVGSASAFDAALVGDKVVIVGTTGANLAAARVSTLNGALDPAFGAGGVTQIAEQSGFLSPTLRATTVLPLPDGRLFVGGNFTFFDTDPGELSNPFIYAVRLTANGQVDPTFGAFPNFSSIATPACGAVLSNGRVILSIGGFRLTRLNENGSRDTTFGSGGIFTPQTQGLYTADNLALQPDGRVLLAGSVFVAAGTNPFAQTDASMIRVDPNAGSVLPVAPAAPSSLSAPSVTAAAVRLTWSDNSNNEASFVVERSRTAGFSSPVTLATLGANSAAFTDTAVAPRTTYFYRVTARNAAGSASTAILSVTTPRRGVAGAAQSLGVNPDGE